MIKPPTVAINLVAIQRNARDIHARTGVPVWAVVKADAYGLGAARVARAITDVVDGFCVFGLAEAVEIDLKSIGKKPIRVLGPLTETSANSYLAAGARPAVFNAAQAKQLRGARPIVSVDTGMQRFACPAEELDAVFAAGQCDEAFTHATRIEHVDRLKAVVGNRAIQLHAAGSALLDEPRAWLNAVRPGIALYRDAVNVTCPLIEARDANGPAGYTGFVVPRFGVIACGYARGLRVGHCSINGKIQKILEVGMQTAFVETSNSDRAGDEVTLLGNEIPAAQIAKDWKSTEHEVLVRLSGAGERVYRE